jgi:hypothetical protein
MTRTQIDDMKNTRESLVGNSESLSSCGKPGRRCEDNIGLMGNAGADWIDLA